MPSYDDFCVNGCFQSSIQKSAAAIDQHQWDSKTNPAYYVFIQGWMLLALAVSIFVPKSSKLLWFLRTHFARNMDERYVQIFFVYLYCHKILKYVEQQII